jgi:hypothetical protein
VDSISTDASVFETLDFLPKTVVTIKLRNANSLLNDGDLTVTYRLPPHMLVAKPLFLSGVIFCMLMLAIVSLRIDVSLTDKPVKQKQN